MTDSYIIERAYELARAGVVQNIGELERRLRREGYSSVSAHLAGPSLRKELAGLVKAAWQRGASEHAMPSSAVETTPGAAI